MRAGFLLAASGDVDFMIHGLFKYRLFGQEFWITTTHVSILVVMLVLFVFALAANLSRANAQVELERKAAADDMKKEMIALASLMAEKAVAGAVDAKVQDTMVESTLKEIGEDTWRK